MTSYAPPLAEPLRAMTRLPVLVCFALAGLLPSARAAELSVTAKAAINELAVRWHAGHPVPWTIDEYTAAQRHRQALSQPGACRAVDAPPPLPERGTSLAFEVLQDRGLSLYYLHGEDGRVTYVREWEGHLPEIEFQRTDGFACETWTTSSGDKRYRVTHGARLTDGERLEALARRQDLEAALAGAQQVPDPRFVRDRCPKPPDVAPRTFTFVDASQALLGRSVAMPPFQPVDHLRKPPPVPAGNQLRLRDAASGWQPVTRVSVLDAAKQFIAWLDHVEQVPDTDCMALREHENQLEARAHAWRAAALDAWNAQAELLRQACTTTPDWTFAVEELGRIRTGYVVQYVDRLHQRDPYGAVALDLDRRLVVSVRAPASADQPVAWFHDDPTVQASCRITPTNRPQEPAAFLVLAQAAPASAALMEAADALLRHTPAPAVPSDRVPWHGPHIPPREELRVNGRHASWPAHAKDDPVYKRFMAALFDSELLRQARR